MAGTLSTLIVRVGSDVRGFETGMAQVHSGIDKSTSKASALGGTFATLGAGLAIGLVGAGVAAVHMAADFQSSMTALVTGAGESKSNIDLVSKGILSMAGEVGMSAGQLASGMYMVESAGYHGADGLTVLRTAAEGAKVGNADMATVADALTSALNAYHLPASKATAVTNDLITTVASGKMHMQDLAGALGAVLPAAAATGVSLQQVTGAIATMTMQGTPAADAATYLRQTMLQLVNPSAKAAAAMKDVGLKSDELSKTLRAKGLTGALQEATDAIGKKFRPGSAEYIAHLADMVGGTKSMQAALELTGGNMATFKANVDGIGKSFTDGGKSVKGWSDVQGDFNQKWSRVVDGLQAGAISIGTKLLPMATEFFDNVLLPNIPTVVALANHLLDVANAAGHILGMLSPLKPVLLAIVAGFVAFKTAMMIQALIEGVSSAITIVSGAMGLLATGEASAATAADALAISELAALAPFLLIALAIGAVIVIGYLLVTHWKQVSAVAMALGGMLKNGLGAAFSWLGSAVRAVLDWLGSHWPLIIAILGGPLGIIVALVVTHFTQIKTFLSGVWNTITGALSAAWAFITNLAKTVFGALSAWFKEWGKFLLLILIWPFVLGELILYAVWSRIGGKVLAVFGAIKDFFGKVWADIEGIFTAVAGRIAAALETAWNAIKGVASTVWNAIKTVASAIWGAISGVIMGPINGLKTLLSNAWNDISSMLTRGWSSLIGAAGRIFGQVAGAIVGALSHLHIPLPHISIGANAVHLPPPIGTVNVPVPHIDWYARGGLFTKPSVIGVGESGDEVVMNRQRLESWLAGVGGGKGRAGVHIENYHVHNPKPERHSDSFPKRLRELQLMASF